MEEICAELWYVKLQLFGIPVSHLAQLLEGEVNVFAGIQSDDDVENVSLARPREAWVASGTFTAGAVAHKVFKFRPALFPVLQKCKSVKL